MTEDRRRLEIAQRTRAGLDEDLEDLRAELRTTLPEFEGRVRVLAEEIPEWARSAPDELRESFEFDDDQLYPDAALGPRLVAEAAAEVEGFVHEWFPAPGASEEEAADFGYRRPTLREFADRAEELLETLAELKDETTERADRADAILEEALDRDLTHLEDKRERDIDALEDLVGEGELDTGHGARQERADLWEEQRRRADHLSAIWEDFFLLVEDGEIYAHDGLDELRAMVQRACEGMEGAFPATGDYLPGGVLARVKSEAEEAARNSGTQPLMPGGSGSTNDNDKKGPGAGSMAERQEPRPGVDSPTEPGPPGGSEKGEAATQTGGTLPGPGAVDVGSGSRSGEGDGRSEDGQKPLDGGSGTDSGRFLRVGPEDGPPPEETPTQPAVSVGIGPEDEADDGGQAPTEPLAVEGRSEEGKDISAEQASGGETRLDLAAEADDEPVDESVEHDERTESSRHTSPTRQVDASDMADEVAEDMADEMAASREPRSDTADVGGAISEASDSPSGSSDISSEVPSDAPQSTPARGPGELVDVLKCLRIRSEWEKVGALEVVASLGPPALYVLGIVAVGLAHVAGLGGAPNPVEAWSWTKPAVAVAFVWLICAPLVMRWHPRWRGWSFDLVHEVDLREEAAVELYENGLEVGDDSRFVSLDEVRGTKVYRWGDSLQEDQFGWMLAIRLDTGESIEFVAEAGDAMAWEASDAEVVVPPADAWQMPGDALKTLRTAVNGKS